jgi:ATP-binding protein involved in chromosome partitioning
MAFMTVTTNGQTDLTKEQIIDAIRPVNDPEIGRGLVDLGMVPNIDIDGRNIRVHIELTTPACPLRGKIEEDVRQALTKSLLPGRRACAPAVAANRTPNRSRV